MCPPPLVPDIPKQAGVNRVNGENDIDEDIENTGDSTAKIFNENYNGIKIYVEIDEDIAVDVDIKKNRVSEVDGNDNYKHLKI